MNKILIVDDDAGIRGLVDTTLRSDDYQIFQAESGEQAIELAKAEKPDLIIMDIMMPGKIDGLEAARMLKKDPGTAGCQIIMLTGRGQKGDREKSLDAGANDFFSKPFSPLALIKKVEEVMG